MTPIRYCEPIRELDTRSHDELRHIEIRQKERILSLEGEIVRLNEVLQARDSRIRELLRLLDGGFRE